MRQSVIIIQHKRESISLALDEIIMNTLEANLYSIKTKYTACVNARSENNWLKK